MKYLQVWGFLLRQITQDGTCTMLKLTGGEAEVHYAVLRLCMFENGLNL